MPSKPLPEIAKCPFPPCKGKGVSSFAYTFPIYSGRRYLVACDKCLAEGPRRKTERASILAWNRAQRSERTQP